MTLHVNHCARKFLGGGGGRDNKNGWAMVYCQEHTPLTRGNRGGGRVVRIEQDKVKVARDFAPCIFSRIPQSIIRFLIYCILIYTAVIFNCLLSYYSNSNNL